MLIWLRIQVLNRRRCALAEVKYKYCIEISSIKTSDVPKADVSSIGCKHLERGFAEVVVLVLSWVAEAGGDRGETRLIVVVADYSQSSPSNNGGFIYESL